MSRTIPRLSPALAGALLALGLLTPGSARAHCDGTDGPVVQAARQALAAGQVERVLMWVQPQDDAEVRRVFQHTLAVRKLGRPAQELADRFFFETVVRIHRAGEGAPYTGIKPAGRDLGPALPAADRALETGRPQELVKLLNTAVHDGLHGRYLAAVAAKRGAKPTDVKAGRAYVKAYVDYVHFVERIYHAARGPAHGAAPAPAAHHEH